MTTTTDRLADLRDRLAHADAMAAAAYGNVTQHAVWTSAATRLRKQIEELES